MAISTNIRLLRPVFTIQGYIPSPRGPDLSFSGWPGDVTNRAGLSPCILPRKCKSGPMPPSRAKNWQQKSANPALLPRMPPGSIPRDGRWQVHNFIQISRQTHNLKMFTKILYRLKKMMLETRKKYYHNKVWLPLNLKRLVTNDNCPLLRSWRCTWLAPSFLFMWSYINSAPSSSSLVS